MAGKSPTVAAQIRAHRETLKDGSPEAQLAAVAALGALADKRCYPPLAAALKSERPQLVAAAASALSGGWDDRALPALISREEDIGPAATDAIEALIAAVGPRAVPGLVGGTASNKPHIAERSQKRLDALSSALAPADLADGLILAMTLKSVNARKQLPHIAAASLPKPEVVRVCLEALDHKEARNHAPGVLRDLGAPGVAALVSLVETGPGPAPFDTQSMRWRSALQTVVPLSRNGTIPREQAIPLLRAAAITPHPHGPSEAFSGLLSLADRDWVLAQLDHDFPAVRQGLLHALTVNREAGLAPRMSQFLTDPAPGVRQAAASALRYCGSADQTAALLEALGDDTEAVRACVADALGAVADRGAVAALAAQRDREANSWTRDRYDRAIRQLGG